MTNIITAARALLDAFGGNVPDWLTSEATALEAALAKPDPIRVVVALEGGLVDGAVADRRGVSVTVVDYDTEGASKRDIVKVPQDGGGVAEAIVAGPGTLYDPAWIDRLDAAVLAHDEAQS